LTRIVHVFIEVPNLKQQKRRTNSKKDDNNKIETAKNSMRGAMDERREDSVCQKPIV
jgi:hypothetical protein